ncbi:hypothetical protein NOI24_20550 [Neorhizobium galegae]|uniref:hypothetical protein n=1 Tax=Neorhizobium galegae TaxID=399 RepID=UPI002107B2CD|nr:hypothetical protein [Neorhizobium galegae]MCQ1773710.1 hypothetical protein [Neorhizobium galegae]MCQ1799737.1 hypothetical protein [Neorhizobium galegae]
MEKREKRRTCADRARAELLTRRIHRRKKFDPALSIAIQLLALSAIVIRLLPPLPDFRRAAAAPLPEPTRPVPLPEPGTVPRAVRYKVPPSWPLLVRDLARPVAHDEARAEVYRRLPPEVGPWLDEVFRNSDWSSLRVYARSGATDDDVGRGVLSAFRTWKADQEEAARKRRKDAKGGKGAGSSSQPGNGDDDDPNDDDDNNEGVKP